jgi:type IV secretion system protein VirD4
MSIPGTVVTDTIALAAMGGAIWATPERLDAVRTGSRSGTRRSHLPPPGRRVSSLSALTGWWRSGRGRTASTMPGSVRWASRRDLGRLVLPPRSEADVDPTAAGRLVLGRAGRQAVAAEARQSVVVFGPTQSGKTSSLAVPAILGWHGPVMATSVKTDLVEHTLRHRRTCGPVQVFDPAGATGYDSAPWTPVPSSRTWPAARRTAAALCEGAKASMGSLTDGDFWYSAASKLLAPLLFAAATGRRGVADVVRWVDTREIDEVLDLLLAAGVPEAVHAARASFTRDDRQRSSIYTTVETVLAPLAHQGAVLAAALDPAGLMDRGGTLYLCAPAHDQRRLLPLFAAVTRATIEHAYERVAGSGRPLEPPLLVVLDEAANIAPLSDLDGLAATAAGHGVQLMTIWHDLAQITSRYGSRATTVVNNHRAKLFLSGISDPQTLDYASHLIGDEEVWLTATTSGGGSGSSTTRSPTTRRLVTPGGVRRIAPGQALLVYGGLPPARLVLRPWTDDPVLRARGEVGGHATPGDTPPRPAPRRPRSHRSRRRWWLRPGAAPRARPPFAR